MPKPEVDSASLKVIAGRLKQARSDAGLTQEHVAREAGVSLQHYRKLEGGGSAPSFLLMQRLAIVLKRPLAYFSGDTQRVRPEQKMSDVQNRLLDLMFEYERTGRDPKKLIEEMKQRMELDTTKTVKRR